MANGFAHIELSTDDVGAAQKFYKTVFTSWKFESIPEMSYTMLNAGKGPGGGLTAKNMPNQPTAWLPYVEVDDVKKTNERAAQAGAQVVVPYQPIGEMGAIGIFIDPTGAALGIWEVAKKRATPKKRKAAAKKKPSAKKPAKKSAKKRR